MPVKKQKIPKKNKQPTKKRAFLTQRVLRSVEVEYSIERDSFQLSRWQIKKILEENRDNRISVDNLLHCEINQI